MPVGSLRGHVVVLVAGRVFERFLSVASVVATRREIAVELLDAEVAKVPVPEEVLLRRAEPYRVSLEVTMLRRVLRTSVRPHCLNLPFAATKAARALSWTVRPKVV